MRSYWRGICCVLVSSLMPILLLAGPVNINTATAEMLAAELTGVGPALAAAIVADRELNGEFNTAEALARVKGIGNHILEINKDDILIADPAEQ